MRALFLLTLLCGIVIVLGCSCDAGKVDNDITAGADPDPDAVLPQTPADDGYLVSTNADGLELKVKAEMTGKEAFTIHYILTNKGSKPINRFVPEKGPFFLIDPYDGVFDKEQEFLQDSPYNRMKPIFPDKLDPKNASAEELVILFGLDVCLSIETEPPLDEDGHYEKMGVGESIKGEVNIQFPLKRTSYRGENEHWGEDQIEEMSKSQTGLPCVVVFAWDEIEQHMLLPIRLIQSKRMMLKIAGE